VIRGKNLKQKLGIRPEPSTGFGARVVPSTLTPSLKLRYIITTRTVSNCPEPECQTPEKAHQREIWTYSLPDGTPIDLPQPGDVSLSPSHKEGGISPYNECAWSNCDGRHLIVVCPDGHHWNVDGRAGNCTMKDEKTHRCWIRHGDPTKPETLTVDQNGYTCKAGAGSILTSSWHGFLTQGELRTT
jgi:hypothetical protein